MAYYDRIDKGAIRFFSLIKDKVLSIDLWRILGVQ